MHKKNFFLKNHPTISCRLNHNKPVEHSDPIVPPTFEFPVFEAEDESEDDIPDEITRLLEQEEKAIQPHQEEIELVNLGTDDNKREIKVGAELEEGVKKIVTPRSRNNVIILINNQSYSTNNRVLHYFFKII